jgi:hypothetical protein
MIKILNNTRYKNNIFKYKIKYYNTLKKDIIIEMSPEKGKSKKS